MKKNIIVNYNDKIVLENKLNIDECKNFERKESNYFFV
jgi:hypothetical protein